jgi:hypothetical protein
MPTFYGITGRVYSWILRRYFARVFLEFCAPT